MARSRRAIYLPLFLAVLIFALNMRQPLLQNLAWFGGLVLFILALNRLINPHLFKRQQTRD